jgi:predicted transcriptional regulator
MNALEQAKALVLVTLRDESPLTIPQIQERWSRSHAYIYWAVDSLIESGLVVCAGWMSPNGHSTRSYKLNPDAQ